MQKSYTDEQVKNFRALFSSVADKSNWKLPTRTFETLNAKEAADMQDAIVFMVGGASITTATVTVRRRLHPDALVYNETEETLYIVNSKGYYHFIGA